MNELIYKKNKGSNPFLMENAHLNLKNCNSSVFSNDKIISHKALENNNNTEYVIKNENTINGKKPPLQKSLSSNNYNLTTTINSIASNIKKIEGSI